MFMNESEDQLHVLRTIQKKSEYTQRELAQKLDLSLGKINYCLKALRKKGYIKIKNFNNQKNKLAYAYFLTPKGIAKKTYLTINFMKLKMKEYDELNKEFNNKDKKN